MVKKVGLQQWMQGSTQLAQFEHKLTYARKVGRRPRMPVVLAATLPGDSKGFLHPQTSRQPQRKSGSPLRLTFREVKIDATGRVVLAMLQRGEQQPVGSLAAV